MADHVSARRFLRIDDVAEMFSTTPAQIYSLVRRGDLRAIKLGGRGQWRIELREIDAYVERQYTETQAWMESHPFAEPPADQASDGAEPEEAGDGPGTAP